MRKPHPSLCLALDVFRPSWIWLKEQNRWKRGVGGKKREEEWRKRRSIEKNKENKKKKGFK